MNYRYKFRGKRVDNGDWVCGAYSPYSWINGVRKNEPLIIIISNDTNDGTCHSVIPETVGQYTGLKDKNGVEIYEGDVVNMHYFFENFRPGSLGIFEDEKEIIGTVGIDECGTYTESDSEIYYWFNYLQDPNEELEVIGNIHDNKELMGGKE